MNAPVLIYSEHQDEPEHERACHIELGRRLSFILGRQFGGYYSDTSLVGEAETPYFVATDTIIGVDRARELGITSETSLFGGVAPYHFVSTKAMIHPVVGRAAQAPQGWSHDFGQRTQHAVLAGYSAFNVEDAHQAGASLLERGPIRIKPAQLATLQSHKVVSDQDELSAVLATLNAADIGESGVVMEENLEQVSTYSVGQIHVGGCVASYVGTLRSTTDNKGNDVYGGSDLIFARGDYPALFALPLETDKLLAVAQAQVYDRAAALSFPELFASRRNYHVACGTDSRGRLRCGVLSHSWRPGGASAAEMLAVEAFHMRPDLSTVKASTLELFGDREQAPAHAVELFNGEDRELGPIRKYVMLERYGADAVRPAARSA